MTHELILTSATQGLDPKDSGFCPVAADSDISPRVAELLATLSGYRYLIEESGELSLHSPVVYSHIILPGGLEYVLSRVAGVGTDFRGQPNALAHHVVLEQIEHPAENPAWFLALPGFHITEWNVPPVRFSQGRPIPTLTTPPSLTRRQQIARQHRWLDPQKMALTGLVDTESESYHADVQRNDEQIALVALPTTPCPVWKELTGDAGWGGVLADTVFTKQPVVLIYNPEQNILPLFVEALALLPEYVAWRTTFCTYFTGLPEVFSCQWKGVIAGSDEAKPLIKDLNNLVIDLTAPMGEAPGGQYVGFARFGQEHMLPLDMEEHYINSVAASAETKTYGEDTKGRVDKPHSTLPEYAPVPAHVVESSPPPSKIQLPPKKVGVLESLLRRSSQLQFYLLYCVMFILVLFLLLLAIDQAGKFGIVETLQNWNQPPSPVAQNGNPAPPPQQENDSELDNEVERDLAQIEEAVFAVTEDTRKAFVENRAKQRESFLQFWTTFTAPEFLAISFPDVHDHQINVPAKKMFAELSPLHVFGSALELRFIPLFKLPVMKVETSLVLESLPDLVWKTSIIDAETDLAVPMFLFRLTETGLEMDWQLEGLNNQYLYFTILSSLGFLELSVAEEPESVKEIPLFAPVDTGPMDVSDLANLSEQEPPEHVITLPFASELWQVIFNTMNPPYILRLEIQAEPAENWAKIIPLSESKFQTEVRTTQQSRRPIEGGDTFENIVVTFTAEASLEGLVWTGDEYGKRLRAEREKIDLAQEDLVQKIGRLDARIFDGDQSARQERDGYRTESQALKLRCDEIDSILEKLPAAYTEISEKESGCFRYSVVLKSELTNRQLLILRTMSTGESRL